MNSKVLIDFNKLSPSKYSAIVEELERLGVWHNGRIVCDDSLNPKVIEIMDRHLLNKGGV